MVEPVIVPRSEHTISRRDIDPDALKVLYRLKDHGFRAYLVGGSVRDLLLTRRPKDFDIGTDAHPYEIKKLFRNCWIIGRRFRLAHVKFGPKAIEVATFRRNVPDTLEPEPEPAPSRVEGPAPASRPGRPSPDHHHHRENTFGTPEEDAFRRDFTVNALFYDIANFSIIDYVGGLNDLRARVVRCIGEPDVRFHEDPVRMLRAVVLAARLDFAVDPPILDAIARNQALIATAAAPRLLEEYYKILRSGSAERTFRALRDADLLRHVTPELHDPPPALWDALRALDAHRGHFAAAPDTLTNAILMGTVLAPLELIARRPIEPTPDGPSKPPRLSLGLLPIARRDVEHLHQVLTLQRRLVDLGAPARVQRGVVHRPVFGEALAWLEIHGDRPEVVEHWRAMLAAGQARPAPDEQPAAEPVRRRRRRWRGRPPHTPPRDQG